MEMKIEKNVPLPSSDPREKYPFREMEVGDSVLITDPEWHVRATNAAYMVGAREGKKFKSRRTWEGMRIWRIE